MLATERELYAVRELAKATTTANEELAKVKQGHADKVAKQQMEHLAKVKQGHADKVAKQQMEHQAEVRELHSKISKMVEESSNENRKIQEAHMDEMRLVHERHTKEVRKIQEQQHSQMQQELGRHVEEVRRLQAEYKNQLKVLGLDSTRFPMVQRSWCTGGTLAAQKENIPMDTLQQQSSYGKVA